MVAAARRQVAEHRARSWCNQKVIQVIYRDFSAAFQIVCHSPLIFKIQNSFSIATRLFNGSYLA